METINGRPGLRMAVRRRPKSVGAGLPYGRPIGHSPALCVTYSATAAIQLPLVALYKCYALTITGPNVPLWPITNSPYIHARRNVAAGKRIYSTQFPGAGDMTFVAGDRSLTTWYPVAAADIKNHTMRDVSGGSLGWAELNGRRSTTAMLVGSFSDVMRDVTRDVTSLLLSYQFGSPTCQLSLNIRTLFIMHCWFCDRPVPAYLEFTVTRLLMKLFQTGSATAWNSFQFLIVSHQMDIRTAKFSENFMCSENYICTLFENKAGSILMEIFSVRGNIMSLQF